MYGTYSGLAKNTAKGIKVGQKAARMQKDNIACTAYKMLRGVFRYNKLSAKDIPPILGGIGFACVPVPMSTTFFYTLGVAIKKGLKLIKK